jgi:hypothetical protein
VKVRELLATFPVALSQESIDAIANALEFDPARRPAGADVFARQVAGDLSAD